jgi:hydroxymethylpyrimidine/phosphomethylpyrimidine kinase
MMTIALTIAGSDSSGGAGIQADLKTFSALGIYGASAITAVTVQNTVGVRAVHDVPADIVAAQAKAVLCDLDVRAIKIGMLFSAEIAAAIAEVLMQYPDIPVVLDPVMIATSGDRLMRDDAVMAIIEKLFPRAICITPNLAEAAFLTGQAMAQDEAGMAAQGQALLALGARAVLMKGGHGSTPESVDLLVTPEGTQQFSAERIETRNTHGTGCTLSAAIAANLALGLPLDEAVAKAKTFLTGALKAARGQSIGHGSGPVHHFHAMWKQPSASQP